MHILKCSALALAIGAASQTALADNPEPAAADSAELQATTPSNQAQSNGLVADSKLNVLARNFYYKDDDKSAGAEQSYAQEWAQGLISSFESGFTQGRIGFGVDAHGLLGLKLDSGRGRAGTGMLPSNAGDCNAEGQCGSQDSYGEVHGALKARVSNTTLKYGEMFVHTPLFDTGDTRLLPEAATGFLLTSTDVENLEVNLGHFTAANQQASTNSDDVFSGYAGVMDGAMDFAGGVYSFSDSLSASLYAGELQDYWRQYYANLTYGMALSDAQQLDFNVNLYQSYDAGSAKVGAVDNRTGSLAATYTQGVHALTLAYQQVDGDTPFDYVGNYSIYLANSYYSDFNGPNEKSWQLRYDLDLGELLTPGLTAFAAYLKGYDINARGMSADSAYQADWGARDDQDHHELDFGARYLVQEGAAKDLNFYLVQQVHRGSQQQYDGSFDRVRLIIEYPLGLL
ncbi:MAG: OprD family porin [Pseudomonas sp.]|uniref:OprD family porin n=1 Tax=Pseudomonas sp. TaxID=306 RepID=UPI002733B3EA|nr:OprD family porin [Pseudomonas sp.]MDP3847759.1 OprD family porin [Pseudomonas sp.]